MHKDYIGRVLSLLNGENHRSQLSAEVKSLSKVEHKELLQGAQLPVVVPTQQALAMKADLEIP